MIIIRCVSDQSERLACHVTHINAAFTVCSQFAHHRTGVVSAPPLGAGGYLDNIDATQSQMWPYEQ